MATTAVLLLATAASALHLPRIPPSRLPAPSMKVRGVETTSRVFFDVEIGGEPAGRLEFNLFGGIGGVSCARVKFEPHHHQSPLSWLRAQTRLVAGAEDC